MTHKARQLTAFRDAVDGDSYITADIVSIGGLSDFSRGWRKYDFNYERPKLAIEFENSIEDFQLHISVEKLLNSQIRELFKNLESLEQLLGEEVLIYPDESFERVRIKNSYDKSTEETFRSRFDESQKVLFRGKSCGILRTYPTNISRIESILRQEFTREKNSRGWMSVYVGMEDNEDKTVLAAYRDDYVDVDARWSFAENLSGENLLSEFTESLSIVHSMDEEAEDPTVWIKPVWDLEPEELVSNLFISDNQYWAVCGSPNEVGNEPILDKIKRFLYPSSPERNSSDWYVRYGNTAGESEDWYASLE